MGRFVRATKTQLRRRNVLNQRIDIAQRGLSDVDGKVRIQSHKSIDKAQIQLRKLENKIHKKRK